VFYNLSVIVITDINIVVFVIFVLHRLIKGISAVMMFVSAHTSTLNVAVLSA